MTMKTHIYLTLICLNIAFCLNAQTGIAGYERYNSYEQCTYIDNLAQKLIPKNFAIVYYSNLNASDFKISQLIDTICKKRYIHFRTKIAKDGFLFVNKSIMDKVANLDCDLDNFEISYVYNDRIVTTKEDVMRLLRLRKKRIRISEIVQDEQPGVRPVYIFDK